MKKLSAIILALMLVMSMLPTAFANGETDTGTEVSEVTYLIKKDAVDTTDSSVWDVTHGWKTPNFSLRSVADFGNHGWRYFDADNETEDLCKSTSLYLLNLNAAQLRMYSLKEGSYAHSSGVRVGIELKTPSSAGFYEVCVKFMQNDADVYVGPRVSGKDTIEDYMVDGVHFAGTVAKTTKSSAGPISTEKVIYVDGTTNVILGVHVPKDKYVELYTCLLKPISGTATLSVDKSELSLGDKAAVSFAIDTKPVVDSFVTYTSSVPGVATVSADGTVNAISKGKTTITATVGELSKSVEIEVKAEDEELSGAFDYTEEDFTTSPLSTAMVNTFTAKLGESKTSDSAVIESETATLGESFTVEAPEAEEGYKFLYWAKGMSTDKKQIVSYDETYSFIPTVENTYLIAVYEAVNGENAVNKAEFYNANGQLIETLTADGVAPALPEMAGYNDAEGWALYGTNDVIEAGSNVKVSGMKVYVAKFDAPKTVKVNGKDVDYGEKVSFTAEPDEGEIFKCWKKDDVIVSTADTYEFYAWETCDVEAVYVTEEFTFTGKAMKIFIDTFSAGDKTAVMAEFIGFEDAVEKGVMLGSKRYAMTTNGNQFTIVNDENETDIKGYAIFKDGTIVFDK